MPTETRESLTPYAKELVSRYKSMITAESVQRAKRIFSGARKAVLGDLNLDLPLKNKLMRDYDAAQTKLFRK